MIGRYRIYPAWFGSSNPVEPMVELADREQTRLDLAVDGFEIVAEGDDHRGHYFDFNVRYVPTSLLKSSRE